MSALPHLTPAQRDRAAGVLVGQACGDALGVPYEFQPPLEGRSPQMLGGGLGPYAPGEWSDDTQMAICIARVAADSPLDDTALGRIGRAFSDWRARGATDIGNQTRAVIAEADADLRRRANDIWASDLAVVRAYRAAAERFTATHTHSAGNGALMRNGIVGLTALTDRERTATNARAVAALTHPDPFVLDSCVLHAEAIRHAVMTGEYDLMAGLDLLPDARRSTWIGWLESAATAHPSNIEWNGSTFGALRAAHAAVMSTSAARFEVPPTRRAFRVRGALEAAASAGHDTDTVAAVAGAMAGAVYGAATIPVSWRRSVRGWPGMDAEDLEELALRVAGAYDPQRRPVTVARF